MFGRALILNVLGLFFGIVAYIFLVRYVRKHFVSTWDDDTKYLTKTGICFDLCLKLGLLMGVQFGIVNLPNRCSDTDSNDRRNAIGFDGNNYQLGVSLYYHLGKPNDPYFPVVGSMERCSGLSPEVLMRVFDKDMNIRTLKVAIMFGKVVLVVSGMTLNLFALPTRDPTEPLNEARHYVVYFEATWLAYKFGRLLGNCVSACVSAILAPSEPLFGELCLDHASKIARSAEEVAEWSSFQLLRNLGTVSIATTATDMLHVTKLIFNPSTKYLKALLSTVFPLVWGCLGVMSLAAKIAQLDFLRTSLYTEYMFNVDKVVRLLSFTVAVVSIYDIGDEHKNAVQRFCVQDYEHALCNGKYPAPIWKAWERKLACALKHTFDPYTSFIIMATLDASDLRRLLIDQTQEPPDLLIDLLTNSARMEETHGQLAPRVQKKLEAKRKLAKEFINAEHEWPSL
jgi:hypothetical protein